MANPYSGATSASTALASIRGDDDKGFAHDQVLEPSDLSTWQLIRRLMGYARPHWVSLALSFVTAAISVVLQLYVPILIGQAIDHILAAGRVDAAMARRHRRRCRPHTVDLPILHESTRL